MDRQEEKTILDNLIEQHYRLKKKMEQKQPKYFEGFFLFQKKRERLEKQKEKLTEEEYKAKKDKLEKEYQDYIETNNRRWRKYCGHLVYFPNF